MGAYHHRFHSAQLRALASQAAKLSAARPADRDPIRPAPRPCAGQACVAAGQEGQHEGTDLARQPPPGPALLRRLPCPGRHGDGRRSRRAHRHRQGTHRCARQRCDPRRCAGHRRRRGASPAATSSLGEGIVYADGVRGVLAAAAGATVERPARHLRAAGRSAARAGAARRGADPLRRHLGAPGLRARGPLPRRSRPARRRDRLPLAHDDPDQVGAARGGSGDRGRAAAISRRSATRFSRSRRAIRKSTIDECDPCAEVVAAEQRIANALFRLEVVAGRGHAQRSDPGASRVVGRERRGDRPGRRQPGGVRAGRRGVRVLLGDHRELHGRVRRSGGRAPLGLRRRSRGDAEPAAGPRRQRLAVRSPLGRPCDRRSHDRDGRRDARLRLHARLRRHDRHPRPRHLRRAG